MKQIYSSPSVTISQISIEDGLTSNIVRQVHVSGNTIYATAPDSLNISNDGGSSFRNVSAGWGSWNGLSNRFAVAKNRVHIATGDGVCYYSDDANTLVKANGVGGNMTGIAAEGDVVVAIAGWDRSYLSTDGGQTYYDLLRGIRQRSCAISKGVISIATERGLFVFARNEFGWYNVRTLSNEKGETNFYGVAMLSTTQTDSSGTTRELNRIWGTTPNSLSSYSNVEAVRGYSDTPLAFAPECLAVDERYTYMYFKSNKTLYVYDSNILKLALTNEITNYDISSLFLANGNLYASTWGQGILVIKLVIQN